MRTYKETQRLERDDNIKWLRSELRKAMKDRPTEVLTWCNAIQTYKEMIGVHS